MKKHLAGFAFASVLLVLPFAPARADHISFSVNSGPGYYGPYYPHHGYGYGYGYGYPYAYAVPIAPPVVVGPATWYCPSPAGYYPTIGACYYPWQQVSGAAPVVVQQQPVIVQQQPTVAVPQPGYPATAPTRDADDRQLDAFGTEFNSIKKHDPYASDHLRDLETRVETFRQSLGSRPYFTADIEHNTEKLQQHMQESSISVNPPVAMGPTPSAPAPTAAPQAPVTAAPTQLAPGTYNPGDAQWSQPGAPTPPAASNPYPQ